MQQTLKYWDEVLVYIWNYVSKIYSTHILTKYYLLDISCYLGICSFILWTSLVEFRFDFWSIVACLLVHLWYYTILSCRFIFFWFFGASGKYFGDELDLLLVQWPCIIFFWLWGRSSFGAMAVVHIYFGDVYI